MSKNKKKQKLHIKLTEATKTKRRSRKILIIILVCVCVFISLPFLCFTVLGQIAEKSAIETYQTSSCSDAAVSFGTYPQSRVTDKEILAGLDSYPLVWTYYKDCFAGSGYYGTMKRTGCMKYADAEYIGNRYRAVMIERYRPAAVLDAIAPSTTNQDENGYTENTVYWFLFEPIRWYIFNETDGILLSEKVLDAMPFTNNFYWIDRNFSGDTDYPHEFSSLKYLYLPANLWKTSAVRHWLNHDFIKEAFSSAEKRNLKTTLRLAEGISETKRYGVHSLTADKVFLLTREEVTYCFHSDGAPEVSAVPTDYAKCRGVFCGESNGAEYSWWWLCSPGNHSGDTVNVSLDKNIALADSQFFLSYSLGGIRCAVRLSPDLIIQSENDRPQERSDK